MRESIKKALHVCENDIHDIKKLHFIASSRNQQSFYQQKYYKNWHFIAIEKCLCPPCATVSQGIFMEENNNHISTIIIALCNFDS